VLTGLIRGARERYPVDGPVTVIGSLPTANVCIPLDGISREHARVIQERRLFWLEPVNVRAGVFLNGVLVVRRERLRHLDVITLGRNVDLVFLVRQGERARGQRPGIVRAWLTREGGSELAHELLPGDATLGRSTASNVVVDHGAVSKLHARIRRTSRQLILHDLSSANGTFVNGVPVTSSLLRDGDLVRLADVAEAAFRVHIETGLVDSVEIVLPVGEAGAGDEASDATPIPRAAEVPKVSANWKTRYDYDSEEIEMIVRMQRQFRELHDERRRGAEARSTKKTEKADKGPAKPAKPAAKPVAKPPAKPAAPAPAKPAPAAAAPVPKPETPKPAAAIPTPPPAAQPPSAEPRRPTLSERASGMTPPPSPAPAAEAKVADSIREVRLTSASITVSVEAPGTYLLGRALDAALRIDHPTVSRRHAQLVLAGDRSRVTLQHVGTSNVTRVNGADAKAPRELAAGDVVEMGDLKMTVAITRG
jgi:pSer/pThr/pTyr-binding forkhead associated (FHA) protein